MHDCRRRTFPPLLLFPLWRYFFIANPVCGLRLLQAGTLYQSFVGYQWSLRPERIIICICGICTIQTQSVLTRTSRNAQNPGSHRFAFAAWHDWNRQEILLFAFCQPTRKRWKRKLIQTRDAAECISSVSSTCTKRRTGKTFRKHQKQTVAMCSVRCGPLSSARRCLPECQRRWIPLLFCGAAFAYSCTHTHTPTVVSVCMLLINVQIRSNCWTASISLSQPCRCGGSAQLLLHSLPALGFVRKKNFLMETAFCFTLMKPTCSLKTFSFCILWKINPSLFTESVTFKFIKEWKSFILKILLYA